MLPRPSSRKHRLHEEKELQITAFLNLMVILIPFLLVTAVFARMAAIELTLPSESKTSSEKNSRIATPHKFRLIISITENEIKVLNNETPLGTYKQDEKGSYHFEQFTELLTRLKKEYPEEKGAIILSMPSISYKTLVETIDTVREGFPDISLGEL
ncbi:MAG: biopolymer transporter ExbD [Nitrospirae bacterium]|nr:biopolymer transporter ExbD [Nitrospirota bacterium]